MPRLSGSKVFTSLDAVSGFYKIPLHKDSHKLTTFITPFGRYAFYRLPFGILCAPEIFQPNMTETLLGLEGTEVYTDVIPVHGNNEEEHKKCLKQALRVIKADGLKLNKGKHKFKQRQIKFLEHIIDANGVIGPS